jgi:hypothetical protein
MRLEFYKNLALLFGAIIVLDGCNYTKDHASFGDASAAPNVSLASGCGGAAAGIGCQLQGSGASSVPTAKGLMFRIENAMGLSAATTASSLRTTYGQIMPDLSNAADPTQFSGGDGNMMLAYAACVDSITINNPSWGLTAKNPASNAANQAALIAAGMKIMDQYTAGLASGGSNSAQVQTAITNIVSNSISDGATVREAFITVCTAANTAGSTLLGF